MSCDWFVKLLLQPDKFTESWRAHRQPGFWRSIPSSDDLVLIVEFLDGSLLSPSAAYDDTQGED